MKTKNFGSRGFTLMEIIVILAVLSILVATLTPVILKYVADAQLNRAKSDVVAIATALNSIIQDTGQYPGSLADNNFVCGPGGFATVGSTGWASAATGAVNTAACALTGHTPSLGAPNSLASHLIVNDPNNDGAATGDYKTSGNNRWKGPYVQSLNEDPWGNAYQVNVSTLKGSDTNPTWVISAGPDGIFQTSTTATTLASGSDDIGIRVK